MKLEAMTNDDTTNKINKQALTWKVPKQVHVV